MEDTDGISFEIIVVDNDSTDGSAEMISEEFPAVRLIKNSVNRYFCAAHNQALAIARGQFFLILNSDTLIPRNTLATLSDYIRNNERAGVVTCRELDGLGKPVITGSRFPSVLGTVVEWTSLRDWPLRSVLDHYLMSEWQRETSRTIDVGTGCFLMARTALLKQFGGFDEGIRLYYSEHDLCQQISRAGFEVHFRPEVHYIHFGQRSSSQESFAAIRKIHFEDMSYYFAKYHGGFKAYLMMKTIGLWRSIQSVLRRLSWRFVGGQPLFRAISNRLRRSYYTHRAARALGCSASQLDVSGPCVIHGGGRFMIGENVSLRATPRLPIELFCDVGGIIRLRDNCFLNQGTRITCSREVSIGERCLIADQALIMDTDFPVGNGLSKSAPVIIERGASIGARTIILKGVTVGADAVVGAGAVVARSIPPYEVAVGNPARVVAQSEDEACVCITDYAHSA